MRQSIACGCIVLGIFFVGCSPPRRDKALRVQAELRTMADAMQLFHNDHERWPDDLQELVNPPPRAGRESPQYLIKVPTSPWDNRPYIYEHDADGFRLIDLGADGQEGGTGLDEDTVVEHREPAEGK